jgi:hypothetical protein
VIQMSVGSEKGVSRRLRGETVRLVPLTIILLTVACAELPELARLVVTELTISRFPAT